MTWTDTRNQIVARLKVQTYKDQPLRVTTRLKDVNAPCVWVAFDGVDYGAGYDEQTWRLFLVAPQLDDDTALTVLEELHELVLGAGFSPTEATTFVGLNVPAQRDALPALRFSTTEVL